MSLLPMSWGFISEKTCGWFLSKTSKCPPKDICQLMKGLLKFYIQYKNRFDFIFFINFRWQFRGIWMFFMRLFPVASKEKLNLTRGPSRRPAAVLCCQPIQNWTQFLIKSTSPIAFSLIVFYLRLLGSPIWQTKQGTGTWETKCS